jgi:hypothetical protein
MASVIYYGVGQHMRENYQNFVKITGIPVCFCDKNVSLHHTSIKCEDENIFDILPIIEAISKYPDYEIWLTQHPMNLSEVMNFLLSIGIPNERIRLFSEPSNEVVALSSQVYPILYRI